MSLAHSPHSTMDMAFIATTKNVKTRHVDIFLAVWPLVAVGSRRIWIGDTGWHITLQLSYNVQALMIRYHIATCFFMCSATCCS